MTILLEYVLPLAVVISAAATSATAAFAYSLWRGQHLHDRALFGDDELNHPGVVDMVSAHHRVIKQEHGLELEAEDIHRPK